MQHARARDGGQLYLFPTDVDLCMPLASLFQQAHTSIAACVRCALDFVALRQGLLETDLQQVQATGQCLSASSGQVCAASVHQQSSYTLF